MNQIKVGKLFPDKLKTLWHKFSQKKLRQRPTFYIKIAEQVSNEGNNLLCVRERWILLIQDYKYPYIYRHKIDTNGWNPFFPNMPRSYILDCSGGTQS